ncbi:hypothetical protein IGI04_017497 [Brassica rapa subsp. trilocularis]|uniref:J domain-containing protein n=1 Tax=Brassica rapa subsp. trilocularis TaxID=1813537 RepID=A0ABQ7MC44_BRACM|nr:hypothetical protein IGI04_017497 [Brassica rapa subsp. trilocularis]
MNAAIRAAIQRPQSLASHLKTALFHSTPVLERKRRTSWESSWHDDGYDDDDEPSSRKQKSWYKKKYAKKETKGKWDPRHFDFCEADDDFDIDYVFRTAFGGPRGFSFSFTFEEDEPPRWHHRDHSSRFSNNSNKKSWRSKHRIYEEEDGYTSTESSDSESEPNQASHRQALGLSPSGPLNLKEVKNAFRTCALKWHPDRHQGSTKEAAEAKFKLCSVAYESLCEKLAVN